MAKTLVQFRADETARIQAMMICDQLGFDLATYLRICMSKLIRENGVPFSMKLNEQKEDSGISAMKAASLMAEERGISDMTLDEINQEISKAREAEA